MTDVYQVSNYTPCQIGLVKGEKGESGANGANGLNGKDGKNGKDGLRGLSGSDGKSNYQLALDAGFIGSLDDYLLSMKCDATELSNKVSAVEDGLSTANTEIDKVKLDTGITATAKFGGVARTQAEKNSEILSIKDFGAVGDGVADDTNALRNAIQSGGAIHLVRGETYRITRGIYSSVSNTTIIGNKASIYADYPLDTTEAPLRFNGSLNTDAITTFNGAFSKGSSYIVVDSTSSFSIGDSILITSDDYKYGISGVSGLGIKTKGEFNQIWDIDGNNLYLSIPLKDSYKAGTKTVQGVNFLKNIKISDINFVNNKGEAANTDDVNQGARAIRYSLASDITITNCSFDNFRRAAVYLESCTNILVTHSRFKGYDIKDTTNQPHGSVWFTGVIATSCENIVFTNNHISNSRRGLDVDSKSSSVFSRNIVISDNIAYNCVNLAGSHACEDIVVTGNIGNDCHCIGLRAINVTVTNNVLRNTLPNSSAVALNIGHGKTGTDNYSEDFPVGDVIVTGNIFEGGGVEGIVINGDSSSINISNNVVTSHAESVLIGGKKTSNIIIADNTLTNAGVFGINIPNLTTSPRLELNNVKILNNIVTVTAGSGGIKVSGSQASNPSKNVTITGNTVVGPVLRSIYLRKAGENDQVGYFDGGSLTVDNNNLSPMTRESDFHNDTSNATHPRIANNSSPTNFSGVRGSFLNASFNKGFSYDVGMLFLEEKPTDSSAVGYVCIKGGTVPSSSAVNMVVNIGSLETRFFLVSSNQPLAVGSYITIAGAGLPEGTKITAVSGSIYTVNNRSTNTEALNGAAMEFTPPQFKEF